MSPAGAKLEVPSLAERRVPMDDVRIQVFPSESLRGLVRLPAAMLLFLIRQYQRFLSPLLPVVTMGACACRFTPSCSHYAAEAVRTHGALAGTWLAVRRLLKCTPLHPGGFDPVPPVRKRPSCNTSAC